METQQRELSTHEIRLRAPNPGHVLHNPTTLMALCAAGFDRNQPEEKDNDR